MAWFVDLGFVGFRFIGFRQASGMGRLPTQAESR
jgi:hypothetical protein